MQIGRKLWNLEISESKVIKITLYCTFLGTWTQNSKTDMIFEFSMSKLSKIGWFEMLLPLVYFGRYTKITKNRYKNRRRVFGIFSYSARRPCNGPLTPCEDRFCGGCKSCFFAGWFRWRFHCFRKTFAHTFLDTSCETPVELFFKVWPQIENADLFCKGAVC